MAMSSVGTLKSVKRMPAAKTLPRIAAGDFTRDLDIAQDELLALLDLAQQVKSNPRGFAQALAGKYITLLFEKPSLRTRFTFELAIKQLGGDSVLNAGPIDDLAHWSSVPVINALSDRFHPCQALADVFTLQERFGDVRGLKLAFVGDGNNVAHSLMLASLRLGMNFSLATPVGYEPDAEIVAQAEALAAVAGGQLVITHDASEAVDGAQAVYTDVWASMGQEHEKEKRIADFAPYQVNPELFAQAAPEAIFLHCLPAKRGEEVDDQVIECSQSAVFDQAENRLHVQKALLLMLLG